MNDSFLKELKKLQRTYMKMGITVSDQIYQSIKSFTDNDQKLARKIVEKDTKVNDEEVDLEKESLNLIALKQPVANNFRAIISLLKASSDLERIGDHASTIARETLRLKTENRMPDVNASISQMSLKIRGMLESSLDAYVHEDEQAARLIAEEDLLIDKKFVLAKNIIITDIEKDNNKIELVSSYLMVVRLLERIGDHIVNLSEWIVYNSTGKIVELNPGKIEPDLIAEEIKKDIK
ncbi:phosphate transport system regulatory protein PhoU [Apilactobacillus micheneri]|uniref:Phosphate-specific transport system accessory protein PhoU n=1 Tax=Apilactobacillus micheneri TaxID=1899430 RepID=A0ABY2YWQ9_9LACO|nr:phosphate signaling complex protein PhoU [Apilactobacillus micheneri]TPR24767.1 phosphate transport system regulatory protein PhoU [Apilactobacillus micheneri]TPR26078.1 phosphate transport system regulatory protein PhoU [Apilactobacillus micheneri]TPR28268.1 phosphate transport system regulatory protein PhoU [Apilactobacillus micheneri]TPR29759.1 phosphate transport system regulatory protein PhoU [Apilactobacillus micheneri]TPR30545.1 phosphate transport system regulatory protein PhoU [Api